MDPITSSALIATGGNLAGGLIGKSSDKKAANKAYKRQKEFAQNALSWKVTDAKNAGLHPLFALGGGSASYQPSFMAGQDPMGTAVSDSAQQLGQAYAQSKTPPPGTPVGAMGRAQLRAVNAQAQRDEAAAIRDLSAARRSAQAANHTQDTPLMTGDGTVPAGMVKAKAVEQLSAQKKDPTTMAGKGTGFQEIVIGKRPDGTLRTMKVVRSEDPAEGMEGMGALALSVLKNLGVLDWQDYNPLGPYMRLGKRMFKKRRGRRVNRRGSR